MSKLKNQLQLQVPASVMRSILKQFEVKPISPTSESYADSLATEDKCADAANAVLEQFAFAGKTLVTLWKPINDVTADMDDIEYFGTHLENKYSEIFNKRRQGISPTVEPQLSHAINLGDRIILEFIYQGRDQRTFNYQEGSVETMKPTLVDYVVVHFSPFMLEFRCPQTETNKFRSAMEELLGLDPDATDWFCESLMTESEIDELGNKLHASLRGAKHKMTHGAFDSVDLKAKDQVEDLYQEDEYMDLCGSEPTVSKSFSFEFLNDLGFTQQITFEITNTTAVGRIFIRTNASEDAIRYVVNTIIEIRKKNQEHLRVTSTAQG